MGKAGRVVCIFTPMALTIASFICLVLIQVAGWNTLDSYYFFKANLTAFDATGSSGDNQALSDAIGQIKVAGGIGDVYNVHLWNYCYSNNSDGSDKTCSKRESQFVFNPIDIWGLNTTSESATTTTSSDNAVESAINSVKQNYDELEDELLGSSGKKALDAYKSVAKWMFIAYQIAFWCTLATIVLGLLAVCSRWGSLTTWILSFVSSLFTLLAVASSTALFAAVVGALGEVLEPYNIQLSLGRNAMVAGWLAVLFGWAATLFWAFSICCCSGRSNPHHKSNKGGLWNAEPKGQGYGGDYERGRGSLKVEKTGGGYERVASPYVGAHGDQVPLHDYAQPNPYVGHQPGYEPYRHN